MTENVMDNHDFSYSTSGLTYAERVELINKIGMIPIGTECWRCGSSFGDFEERVIVTENNREIISLCWNSSYFLKYEDAKRITDILQGWR